MNQKIHECVAIPQQFQSLNNHISSLGSDTTNATRKFFDRIDRKSRRPRSFFPTTTVPGKASKVRWWR